MTCALVKMKRMRRQLVQEAVSDTTTTLSSHYASCQHDSETFFEAR